MRDGKKPVRLTRRVMLGALLGSAAGTAMANAPLRSIRPMPRDAEDAFVVVQPLADLIAASGVTGSLGFLVADAETGEVLESWNPDLALPPASVTKAITAVYAFEALGGGHRFKTRVLATGPIVKGKVQGDLVLEGGGDPTLDTDALGDLARRLKAAGVSGVTGRFKVCSGALPTIASIDPDQPDHVGYNPTISALNLNYNRVHFEWKQQQGGYAVSMDARAGKYSPKVQIARMQVVERRAPVYTYADVGGADEWTVARPALGQGGSRWLPVRKPEAYAAEVFQTLARSHGVTLPKADYVTQTPAGEVLVEWQSDDLTKILRDMLKWSTNLTAEVVGLAASTRRGAAPQSLRGSATAMNAWASEVLGSGDASFVDHSGLSAEARVNAANMVAALSRARVLGELPGLMKEIPMRNDRGEVLPDHPVKIRAKTGTLNFVSALAGYVSATGGRNLVFAFFSADLDQRAAIDPSAGEIPPGSRPWKAKSRLLQLRLIERWGFAYGA